MNLSVVIPAYNEEDNIISALKDVWKAFPTAEIIIINDASTDKTLEKILKFTENLPVQFIKKLSVLTNEKNMGHGYSVIRGLKEATGNYILYIDADRQIDLYPNMIEWAMKWNYDVVSGQRVHRQDKLFRKIISFFLKLTILIFYRYYVRDANCPYKIYSRKALRHVLNHIPSSKIIPIACIEVLARQFDLKITTTITPHKRYAGIRQGFLQGINLKMLKFCWSAFKEIVNL